VAHNVQESLRDQADYRDIRMMITGRGLVIHLPEFLFFATGEAQIRPEAEPLLDRLADILQKIPNHVVVEGHTDNRPINTPNFPAIGNFPSIGPPAWCAIWWKSTTWIRPASRPPATGNTPPWPATTTRPAAV
jgi:hypothetical protein